MTNLDYLYNPEAAKAHFTKNYFVDKKLGFSVIENGIILPHKKIPNAQTTARKFWGAGGIVDKNGTYFKRSFVNNGDGKYYTPPRINSIQLGNRCLSWNVLSRLGTCHHRQSKIRLVLEKQRL